VLIRTVMAPDCRLSAILAMVKVIYSFCWKWLLHIFHESHFQYILLIQGGTQVYNYSKFNYEIICLTCIGFFISSFGC
jgi:hypothetical protein